MGIAAAESEILSSGWAAAAALRARRRRAFVVGEAGLVAELERAGVPVTQDTASLDPAVTAVVVRGACGGLVARLRRVRRWGSTGSLTIASSRRRRPICGIARRVRGSARSLAAGWRGLR